MRDGGEEIDEELTLICVRGGARQIQPPTRASVGTGG